MIAPARSAAPPVSDLCHGVFDETLTMSVKIKDLNPEPLTS